MQSWKLLSISNSMISKPVHVFIKRYLYNAPVVSGNSPEELTDMVSERIAEVLSIKNFLS